VIERRRVASEICFDDVEVAVHVVIGGGDAHASLRFAVGAESATGFERDVSEFSVVLVLIERAGGGVVGDVNVGPAIVVEIGGEDAEAVSAVGAEDSGGFGDVGESAVTVVVKQNIFSADETGRAARDHYTFI